MKDILVKKAHVASKNQLWLCRRHSRYLWVDSRIRSKGKVKTGQKTCRFVQPPDNEKSIIPRILKKLLKARKDTRAKIKTTEDPFKKKVYDGLQLGLQTHGKLSVWSNWSTNKSYLYERHCG